MERRVDLRSALLVDWPRSLGDEDPRLVGDDLELATVDQAVDELLLAPFGDVCRSIDHQPVHLGGDVVVIGVMNRVEIWDPARWQEYSAAGESAFSELSEEVFPGV